jgi:DNA-binding Lrp family transcriptional regulator
MFPNWTDPQMSMLKNYRYKALLNFQVGKMVNIIFNYDYDELLDEIDKVILSELGKNARISSLRIAYTLKNLGYDITDRSVRHRLERLEKSNVILGYSIILNPGLVSEKISRTVVLRFKFSKNSRDLIEKLKNYVEEASFCLFSTKLGTGMGGSGEFDWICHFVFDSIDQYELETDNFLTRFAELIADYRSYESKMIKASPYSIFDERGLNEQKERVFKILNSIKKHTNLNDTLQEIVESLVKYFHAKFARIWFLDSERQNLILKFSAGMYKNIDGEFSRVSIDSVKIGAIAKTKKPAITNDVVHDPRIKHPEWAEKEKMRSFGGYPLMYKGEVIGVLAMFSEKKLSPADFEILGVFCDYLSKEFIAIFNAAEFLAVK